MRSPFRDDMQPQLKICGITNLADARYCAAAGADYLGFIQYEKSPRYVSPDVAREIIGWMYGPKAVGVFVNEEAERVNQIAEETGFAMVQLHGTESPDFCAEMTLPVIKALHVSAETTPDMLKRQVDDYVDTVAYFLLDTKKAGLWGGTGISFDWQLARELADYAPLFLAGGLNATNIAEAIQTVQPFGVDLSSSLEESPGRKDIDKLAAFFDAFHEITTIQS